MIMIKMAIIKLVEMHVWSNINNEYAILTQMYNSEKIQVMI